MDIDTARPRIARRLRDVLEARGFSVRQFQLALAEKAEVPGTSVGAVYRYLNAEVTPPVEFLLAAGDVLGVDPQTLIFPPDRNSQNLPGRPDELLSRRMTEEEKTEEELRLDKATAIGNQRRARLRQTFPAQDQLANFARFTLWEAADRLANDYLIQAEEGGRPADMADINLRSIEVVAETLACGLRYFDSEELDRAHVDDYVTHVCQGLMRLVPSPRERRGMSRQAKQTVGDGEGA